ncbi:hypothetical protein GOP47_0022845 [Adiantum capillus-veneris]|uniref:Uncharacterized protein n=1 Tax=Adiantum capillus-veneris TaxID=13818 RepID=A0A9D4Z792_ADICA|nr:hypothetical protein GOP47_0022845 [Adiantum capillus-veneris]
MHSHADSLSESLCPFPQFIFRHQHDGARKAAKPSVAEQIISILWLPLRRHLVKVELLWKRPPHPCIKQKAIPCSQKDRIGYLQNRSIQLVERVCRWFRDLAKRLWKEFCLSRAHRMVSDLRATARGIVEEEWNAIGKLMIYCAGCHESQHVCSKTVPGHFVRISRFSKTSGLSFLLPECRADVLYISDPCEHLGKNGEDDIGLFRGVFKSFSSSKTLKLLVGLSVKFEPNKICPYCYTSVWSLLNANMIPKSSHRRLGAHRDVEYFVCVNGHLYGRCSLLHLSDDEVSSEED